MPSSRAQVGNTLQRVPTFGGRDGSSTCSAAILFSFTAGTFDPHTSPSLHTGPGAYQYPTAPFARPSVCPRASYRGGPGSEGGEGADGVGGCIGVGGGHGDGNGVGRGNGDVNGDGDGDRVGVGTKTGTGWRRTTARNMGTLSVQTGGRACVHPIAPFARPVACTCPSHRGGNRAQRPGGSERDRWRNRSRGRGRRWEQVRGQDGERGRER